MPVIIVKENSMILKLNIPSHVIDYFEYSSIPRNFISNFPQINGKLLQEATSAVASQPDFQAFFNRFIRQKLLEF